MNIELKNESTNKFIDISSEEYRQYTFPSSDWVSKPDGSYGYIFHELKIESPVWLSVSESGGHRILDQAGISHYIPKGWVALSWKAKPNQPHFVK